MTDITIAPENELPVCVCRECGNGFRQKRRDQVFCRPACNRKFYRRREIRGATAVEQLIAWRKTRGAKKGALTEIAAMVDEWIREDREAGRS